MTLALRAHRRWRPDPTIDESQRLPRIAVLGAGHPGPVIAPAAVAAGYAVAIAPPGDPGAVDLVADIVERIGFDAVRLDSLRAGRLFEAGGPVFGATLRRAEFERAVRAEAA